MSERPPVIIEVTRGDRVESRHAVDVIIADADGGMVAGHGDIDRAVFPRSSIKVLQALPLIESGAADKFGLTERHLALACASHNGEAFHTRAAGEMLDKADLSPKCLECGAQLPYHTRDQAQLLADGEAPRAIHNNCSGKHAGFLVFAAAEGIDVPGYVKFDHPVQRQVAETLEQLTGAPHGEGNHGIDGCSIPTYEIPLAALARAFAGFAVANGTAGSSREKAMARLRDACLSHPEMVAGTGRFDSGFMAALGRRAFTKTGAEGVFVAALPERGIGFALKARDGSTRAAETACANLVQSLLELSENETTRLRRFTNPRLKNWNGIEVGEIRMAAEN